MAYLVPLLSLLLCFPTLLSGWVWEGLRGFVLDLRSAISYYIFCFSGSKAWRCGNVRFLFFFFGDEAHCRTGQALYRWKG
jgi:hypothetical protein